MANCPKRGVLNAGDRPARLVAAVAQLQAAAQPFRPRVMPLAPRRTVPMSTPMRAGSRVPMSMFGLGNLPPGTAIRGNGPTDGMPTAWAPGGSPTGGPGTSPYHPQQGGFGNPITHGALGANGTSTNFPTLDAGGPLGALVPFISAITDWAQQVTDAIGAITDTISADGMAMLWAIDQYLGPYTEPLTIWRPEWRPMAVIAARVQDPRAWNRTVLTGCACQWDPNPNGESLTLRSIDGMTPNDGAANYLITFIYFGVG